MIRARSITGQTRDSRLAILDDAAFRETTWRRSGGEGLKKHWAYDANAFVPTRARGEIEWTPGVPDVLARQMAPGELEVRVTSVTPNLKTTQLRIDDGDWRELVDGRLVWELHDGDNRLEIRTRNLLDVDGPPVVAVVTFKQGGK